jgi:hypothetical protein
MEDNERRESKSRKGTFGATFWFIILTIIGLVIIWLLKFSKWSLAKVAACGCGPKKPAKVVVKHARPVAPRVSVNVSTAGITPSKTQQESSSPIVVVPVSTPEALPVSSIDRSINKVGTMPSTGVVSGNMMGDDFGFGNKGLAKPASYMSFVKS